MSELNLSPEKRRRLLRCYWLILRPKGEAEKNIAVSPQLDKSHEHTADIEENGRSSDPAETEVSEISEDIR